MNQSAPPSHSQSQQPMLGSTINATTGGHDSQQPAAAEQKAATKKSNRSLGVSRIDTLSHTLSSSIEAASTIYQLCASCMGPKGRLAMIHMNAQSSSVTVTSTSTRLLPNLPLTLPISRVLVSLTQGVRRSCHDGGLLTTALAAGPHTSNQCNSLVQLGLSDDIITGAPIPTQLLLAGHRLGLKWALAYMTPSRTVAAATGSGDEKRLPLSQQRLPSISLPWSDAPIVLSLVKSLIASKQQAARLSTKEVDYLSVLLLQAFIAGLPRSRSTSGSKTSLSSTVRLLPLSGSPVLSSYILEAGILVDIPLPVGAPRRLMASSHGNNSNEKKGDNGMRVILYNVSLTADPNELFSSSMYVRTMDGAPTPSSSSSSSSSATVTTDASSSSSSSSWDATSVRYSELEQLVEKWHATGVRVVLCQKLIHPVIKQHCLSLGILPIERLSIRHIHAVHAITGGTVLSTQRIDAVTPSVCGTIAAIEEKLIGKRKYLQMTPVVSSSDDRAIATMVVCAPDETAMDELHDTLTGAIAVLTQCLTQPVMLPGGGCTEVMIAQHLRQRITEYKQQQQQQSQSSSSSSASLPHAYHRNGILRGIEQLATCLERLSTVHVATRMSHDAAMELWRTSSVTPPPPAATVAIAKKSAVSSSSRTSECRGWHSNQSPAIPCSVMTLSISSANTLTVTPTTILDPLYIKLNAIQSAVEAAAVILRVDGVVHDTR